MTIHDLYVQLAPVALHHANDTAQLPDDPANRDAHYAASVLSFFMIALDEANAGRPWLLQTLALRVGFVPGVIEALAADTVRH